MPVPHARVALAFLLLSMAASAQEATSSDPLARPATPHVRVLTWNIAANSVFAETGLAGSKGNDPRGPARFARIARAVDADIVCLQEVFRPRTADDVARALDAAVPLPGGARWQAVGQPDIVIAARFPLALRAAQTADWGGGKQRTHALALIDLPPAFGADLLALCTHLESRSEPRQIAARQAQADAIAALLRDVRTRGGGSGVAWRTPMVVMGDLNAYLIDPAHHVVTLRDGAIVDRAKFGQGGPPDWDATPLADALPRHNGRGDATYTFGDGAPTPFPPAAIDRVLFTDSVLAQVGGFVLETRTLDAAVRERAGLEPDDVLIGPVPLRYDHLPLVVDLALKP